LILRTANCLRASAHKLQLVPVGVVLVAVVAVVPVVEPLRLPLLADAVPVLVAAVATTPSTILSRTCRSAHGASSWAALVRR
jgi:hypothetical protein